MSSWRLEIEYDGSRYSGWQLQPHARTIQGELIKAARTVLSAPIDLVGAGRTDAGVHALCQVAHLHVKSSIPANKLLIGLNDQLPADINILRIKPVSPQFNARHDAISRYYLYQIATRRTAFGKPYVWWIKDRLNFELMESASRLLPGMHDFRSFSEPAGGSTLVKVESVEFAAVNNLLLFRIAASHFLWKMVRRLVGALVEVGRGNLRLERFAELLKIHSPEAAAWTAPPSGLFLERVIYPGDAPPARLSPAFQIT